MLAVDFYAILLGMAGWVMDLDLVLAGSGGGYAKSAPMAGLVFKFSVYAKACGTG
jgi:hypothetical protein